MLRAAIVPDEEIAHRPSVAEGEIVVCRVCVKIVKEGPAFLHRHPFEVPSRDAVDVKRAPTCLRVRTHDGMKGCGGLRRIETCNSVRSLASVYCLEGIDEPL